ncbi:DUF5694 domain-containing protein [Sutcliffiella horikoshii]|uniref:DUF5694 domain-containing protein n=1 Tax=Sutcliffiella horikoshii TaxID=79883 RepID=UPI001CBA7201|nr:DUF5694 domain-containing protein [Sutcliffiella horikoshii]UAL45906.1 DUF5694 domain-containing protein [Sutcliffiella horikoshii]
MVNKPSIMILGTDHFEKSAVHDYGKTEELDIFSQRKQLEIGNVITCLKGYSPTKIVLEYPLKHHFKLTEEYREYLAGNFELSANERHQIGFQLAKELGHSNVFAVDWNEEESGLDIFGYMQKHETHSSKQIFRDIEKMIAKANEKSHTTTIREYLLFLNETQQVRNNHQLYMDIAMIGENDNPIGAKWVANYWYYRNLLIYKNIKSLACDNDLLLVIYGVGHVHLLNQLVLEGDSFTIANVRDYLVCMSTN